MKGIRVLHVLESFKLQKCFSDTRWRHVLADEKKWKPLTFPPQSVQRNWSRQFIVVFEPNGF